MQNIMFDNQQILSSYPTRIEILWGYSNFAVIYLNWWHWELWISQSINMAIHLGNIIQFTSSGEIIKYFDINFTDHFSLPWHISAREILYPWIIWGPSSILQKESFQREWDHSRQQSKIILSAFLNNRSSKNVIFG